jgi:hypothetical protein
MTMYLLVVLYLLDQSQAALEQRVFPTAQQCRVAGEQRVAELQLDANKNMLAGMCVEVTAQTVQKESR